MNFSSLSLVVVSSLFFSGSVFASASYKTEGTSKSQIQAVAPAKSQNRSPAVEEDSIHVESAATARKENAADPSIDSDANPNNARPVPKPRSLIPLIGDEDDGL